MAADAWRRCSAGHDLGSGSGGGVACARIPRGLASEERRRRREVDPELLILGRRSYGTAYRRLGQDIFYIWPGIASWSPGAMQLSRGLSKTYCV